MAIVSFGKGKDYLIRIDFLKPEELYPSTNGVS